MTRREIAIRTEDGTASATLFLPDAASPAIIRPGVVLYMDAFGPRPALDQMAERLAAEGYVVLVPDLFYRFGAYGPFDAKTAFKEEASARQLRAMIDGTTQAMTIADTGHFLDALSEAGAQGPAGVVGYCMGGVAGAFGGGGLSGADRGGRELPWRQSGERQAGQPASQSRFHQGAGAYRHGRGRRLLPAGAIGQAGRGVSPRRGRFRARKLCRHGAWLVRAGPQRL